MKKVILLLIALFLSSCSQYLVPPKRPIADILVLKDLKWNQAQALLLHRISKNQKVGCQDILELVTKKNNPIYHWATGQYISKCSVNQKQLEYYYEEFTTFPKWAQRGILQALISKTQDNDFKVKASLSLLPFLSSQKSKVNMLVSLKKISNKNQQIELDQKLFSVAPRFSKVITPINIFSVARDFEKNREFKQARVLYRRIIIEDKSLDNIVKAWNRVRMSYKLQRDRRTYKQETRKLVLYLENFISDPAAKVFYAKYATILARIYWTTDNFPRAKKVLRSVLLLKDLPDQYKITAYYHFAGIYEDLKKKAKAIHYYEKAFKLISDTHELKEAIVWNLGWYHYKIKKYEKAIFWFNQYSQGDSKNYSYRFDFWKAQSLRKIGLTAKADKIFDGIKNKDNFGYYGQIAHMNTGELSPIKVEHPQLELKEDPLSWAIYIENYKLAQSIIDTLEECELSHYYNAKYFNKMIFKYFSFAQETRDDILKNTPVYSYPMAYKEDFLRSNKSNKVSSSLLMAIARQESAFNPSARSPADAFGLLQLIPSQARALSKRYGIPYKEFSDLYRPKTNIALSSMLLDELMNRQKKNFIHFIASYNAGESPVRRWKKRLKKYEDLEFIEQIPYKETRNYVKLVARNYLIYKRMLSEKPFPLSGSFFRDGNY